MYILIRRHNVCTVLAYQLSTDGEGRSSMMLVAAQKMQRAQKMQPAITSFAR